LTSLTALSSDHGGGEHRKNDIDKGEQDQPEAEQVQICPEELPEAAADPGDLLLFGRSELPSDRQRGRAGLPSEHPLTGVKGGYEEARA